ncbi:hypothetical protein ABIB38_003469 [Massilia sp. UYP11]|uniref:DUF3617 domain-containing protein n=1 Tax=Massilia sp. UYP11 TaxID=1756385 RepID=UPI003D245852
MKRTLTSTVLLTLAAITVPNALAQHAQIKPGLWQVDIRTVSETQGGALGDGIQQLVDSLMSPEARKEMAEAKAQLAAKGVEITGNGMGMRTKECITKEQIARFDVLGQEAPESCSVQKSPRPDGVDVRMACAAPEMVMTMDMRLTYRGEKAFDIESVTTTPGIDGQSMTLKGSGSGNWLSSDCGDVKPRSVSQ